ncbi:MAG: multiple sugar transport system permease protein [Actinomycetota bacterium]|nr:multiple sugar transport system permease protein [Actinomycetota bacterium]MDQ1550751.1 multiple sugar transport system permease protein [Actinomycetota bacterium]
MAITTAPPTTSPRTSQRSDGPGEHQRHQTKRWLPYALIAPAVVFELLIHFTPMVTGVWISFLKLTSASIANWSSAPFAGIGNYQIAVSATNAQGAALLNSFAITCGFTLIVVALSWGLGMAAAVALQRTFRGRAIFRTIFLIPYAVPMYAGIIAWKFMFQQQNGVINQLLVSLHLVDPAHLPFWLIGSNAFGSVIIVSIWRTWPFAFLMLMAGLQTINEDLYEASALDGAKPFRQWRAITLPELGGVNRVLVLVLFLWTFNDYNDPAILFGAGQPPAGDLISFHIYNNSFSTLNFGFGAAMSTLLLIFLLIVSVAYLLFVNRRSTRA